MGLCLSDFFKHGPFSFLAMTRMNRCSMIQQTRFFFRFGLGADIQLITPNVCNADKATVRCGCADVRSRAAMRRGYFLVTQDLSTNSIQITTVQTLPCAPSNSNVIMCLWHNINDASAKPLETLRSIFLTNIASSCMIKKQADFFASWKCLKSQEARFGNIG